MQTMQREGAANPKHSRTSPTAPSALVGAVAYRLEVQVGGAWVCSEPVGVEDAL
jgi:hypothetical protein